MAKRGRRSEGPSEQTTVMWFRADLRLIDNPALTAAVERGDPVVPVFIWAPEEEGTWPPGAASKWWLHQSLSSLEASLKKRGSRLILRHGRTLQALQDFVAEIGAGAVYWNRLYEPAIRERDEALKSSLQAAGLEVLEFNGALLVEPWEVATKKGKPFRVFTPFWKACLSKESPPVPITEPDRIPRPARWPKSLGLRALELEPRVNWSKGIRATWKPGEKGASERLDSFIEEELYAYQEGRDRPDLEGTSRLSPHLHFGEVSPRQVWHAVQAASITAPVDGTIAGSEGFLRQLYWREFAYHLLFHEPQTTDHPLREEFAAFPWSTDDVSLRAWQEGRTGFPYIDAGMRQLWGTGWMHNRVRMAVASFLVKDLLIPWQEGAKWFWDTLVDADLANNTMGWQWTAGCGADAAPYFRIFNPITQGERFDPKGVYVRRWVPELAGLPDKYVHRPWEAPGDVLAQAGVSLGQDYPRPIVDHAEARALALGAYETIRRKQ